MAYKAPTEEQETTINMLPPTVSKQAEIYTCIPAMMAHLTKLASEYPSDVAIVNGDGYVTATVPSSWIKVAPKRKCTLSEEQKKANAARLAAYWGSKNE